MDENDADFDAYWEEEARNPNRNRIRIGRQYQATVPPILKQGESDGRNLEELETLRWKSDNELTDQQLDEYLSVAKAVGLFARAIDKNYVENNSVNSDSHKEPENSSETNPNNTSNENTENCDKSEDKTKDDSSASGSTSTLKDHNIQNTLKGLSEFVSSHHPSHHTTGCRVETIPEAVNPSESANNLTNQLSAEWNQNEMKLFSRALEVCGKNFGAIKKDFLPWKSVKSIIEFYYLGIHRESTHSPPRPENLNPNATNQSENILNIKPDSISNSFALDILSSVSKFMACAQTKPQLNCDQRHNLHHFLDNDYDVKTSLDDLKASGVSGQEVKPLKAKPILPTAIQESRDISTVGSLKFYLDGQLVLKLNAQQELLGQKCQWVESLDTAKKAREKLHKTNKRLLIERHDLDLPNHSNHKYLNNDELDEASNESSDDDSMESNESALVPSPSAFIAKKAKVKLENNCLKPLSSPTSLSLKDQKMETNVSNPCNRLMKTECTSVKREHLSPNFATNDDIIEHKKRSSNETTNERRNSQNSLENKWYHTIVEKQSSLQPPKAHSAAPLGQTQRHSRYESTANSWGMSTSSSSSSSSTSSQSSSHSVPTPSQSVPSSAAPVDLTRKSTNYSPFETKSLSTSSSAPNYNSYNEKDKNSKMSSPSPPRLQSPFVFPFPSYLPLSPTQSQSKHKKEVKSSSNLCQKGYENRSQVKPSPPSSPSSMPSTTPPLPSQLAFIQNSLASYLPIYEQYYRYYYGYGMPAPNHSSGERQSSSQASKESDTNNKERAKCMADAVLVDGRDPNCGP